MEKFLLFLSFKTLQVHLNQSCKEKSTEISSSASTAITTLYQEIFGKKTEYSGPAIMGFYNDQIIERLLQDVTFFPIYIKIQSFLVVVSNIGYSKNNGCCGAGNVDEWNNFKILQQAFDRHIKSRKTGKMALLDNWQTCGCTNVTPFEKKESNIEFWSRAIDPSADKETLLNLYNAGLICLKNNSPIIIDKRISKYFYWEWPTEGLLAGFIQARSLPHIGSWSQFSPAVISDLCDSPIVQPQPTLSIHTQATSTWTIPISQLNVDVSDDIIDIANQPNNQSDTENNSSNINRNPNWQHPTANSIDENFQLPKGWALKQNQIFGRKGSGKRMTKKVKSLLELFSLNGNINLQDKLNAQEMHDELLKYVETEEIEEQDVPKVSTIQGWISRYAAALKYQATEAALSK
ncbi:14734_t:CDS:2 [Rhizophagus irregularis]|nr:14734_t:CDS:2 [Rhizophagus irregularis]